MKITCNRRALLDAFAAVAGVVPTRTPKPILQNVKLTVSDDGAELSATDLEVGIRRAFGGVAADEPGSVLLPAARFGQILKASRDDELRVEVNDDNVEVRGLRSSFTLPLEGAALFPDIPEFAANGRHVILADDLRRLIRLTAFACDLAAVRYALGGCLVERSADAVSLVGTDGRRLARATAVATVDGHPEAHQAVAPLKALKLIERNLPDDETPVELAFSASSAMVRFGGTEVYSRLVEGRFPHYQDVFPDAPNVRVAANVGELRASIEQAAITTRDESRGVDFEFSSGGLALAAKAADKGASKVDMPLPFEADAPIAVSLNPGYVLDPLKALGDDAEIVIELIDGKNAVVMRTGETYAYVVMPLAREG